MIALLGVILQSSLIYGDNSLPASASAEDPESEVSPMYIWDELYGGEMPREQRANSF
ncbi:Hypothetical protein FKW44_004597, partial [Caligus rogercresseyi]